MNMISAAERKRLQSLKEKKQLFQKREQIIQKALVNLYNTTNNKKIIFDDDFGEQQNLKPKEKKKVNLFENDDSNNDNEDSLWNEDTFNTRKHKKVTLGHDVRFTLDERFAEDDQQNEPEVIVDIVEYDLQKEKEKELSILESVLGAPLMRKRQETKISKKGLMIRYDPTEKKHSEYEIKSTQSETKEQSIKKKKLQKENIKEPVPVEVSKDIYYTVSDILTESLRQNKEFSLLKACGREKNDTNIDDRNAEECDTDNFDASITKNNNMDTQFRFHFSAENAFKHDSSDNKDANEIFDINEQVIEQSENDKNNSLFEYKNIFFFENDDIRFNEAVKFFNTEVASNNEFKNLRRELKNIVRTKIRRNERKYQPWSKKRKIKRS